MYILDLNHIDSVGLEYLTIEEINMNYPHHQPKQHHQLRHQPKQHHKPHNKPHNKPHHKYHYHPHHRPSYFSNHNLLTGGLSIWLFPRSKYK